MSSPEAAAGMTGDPVGGSRRGGMIRAVSELSSSYDVVVIGAGPAGLAAARELAARSRSVLLVDENAAPGGQIYRSICRATPRMRTILGKDYCIGASLVDGFLTSGCTYAPGTTVWSLSRLEAESAHCLEIGLSQNGSARLLRADHVVMATGAIERPMPIAGWTLPGVMTAGAGQIVLKSAGLIPAGKTVLAGCGPLLYLLAAQILAAGGNVAAVLNTTDRANRSRAIPFALDLVRSPYGTKGLGLLSKVLAATRVVRGVTALEAEGSGRVEAVRYRAGGKMHTIPVDTLLLHQGVIPNINLAGAAGCALEWNARQHAFQPRADKSGRTSIAGLWIAGDGASIAGAAAAALAGRLVALEVLGQIGSVGEDVKVALQRPLRRQLARQQRGRAFLDTLYRPSEAFLVPRDDSVVVCRCEEIRAGQVREAIAAGVPGPNQLKTFLRCGMGPCQGRMCASTVTNMMAAERGVSPAEIGTYRLRFPVKPLRLAELASIPQTHEARAAVHGSHAGETDAQA